MTFLFITSQLFVSGDVEKHPGPDGVQTKYIICCLECIQGLSSLNESIPTGNILITGFSPELFRSDIFDTYFANQCNVHPNGRVLPETKTR